MLWAERTAVEPGAYVDLRSGRVPGELALFEQNAGVVERQATVLAVQNARDLIRHVLLLWNAQNLTDDVEGRRAGVDGNHRVAQARDGQFFIPQTAGQALSIHTQREIDARDGQIEIVGVADTQVDLQTLLKGSGVEQGNVGHQHVRGLALDEPGSTAGEQQEQQGCGPQAYHDGIIP